ncbi:MAG: ester cyclase [Paracoccaceae bacterium]
MHGFDPDYRDFPDYILKITRRIWEGRDVASLRTLYAPDIPFRLTSGMGRGNEAVIDATLSTLAEFPDRELMAEDVVWSGEPRTGMLSSHRIWCEATHLGPGAFGPPTGTRVHFRAVADCHARAGVIDDEWLTRDTGAICRQLGTTAEAHARDLIEAEGGPEHARRPFHPDQDELGPYAGRGNDHEAGLELEDILTRIMAGEVSVVQARYDRAVSLFRPGGIEGRSWAKAEAFWIGLRASFPRAAFAVEHRIGRDDAGLPRRAAIRWSLTGRHSGWGAWGAPSGAQVHIMGFTHAEFGPWGLRAEWTVFDEVAVWKQIALHQAGAGA